MPQGLPSGAARLGEPHNKRPGMLTRMPRDTAEGHVTGLLLQRQGPNPSITGPPNPPAPQFSNNRALALALRFISACLVYLHGDDKWLFIGIFYHKIS